MERFSAEKKQYGQYSKSLNSAGKLTRDFEESHKRRITEDRIWIGREGAVSGGGREGQIFREG